MRAGSSVFAALLAALVVGSGRAADDAVPPFAPKTLPIQSYAGIWKRSPFIVETVAVQVSMGLAARYSLVGVIEMAGQPAVFLIDKNNGDPAKNRVMVTKGRSNKDGIELVSVAMASDPRKSSAVIRQGGQQASLNFDATAMGPTGPNSQPGAVPPAPAVAATPATPNPLSSLIPVPGQANGAVPPPPAGVTPPPPQRRIIRPAPINLNN
jgi:hypothetical protein